MNVPPVSWMSICRSGGSSPLSTILRRSRISAGLPGIMPGVQAWTARRSAATPDLPCPCWDRSMAAGIVTAWLEPEENARSTSSHSRPNETTPAQSSSVRVGDVDGMPPTVMRSARARGDQWTLAIRMRPLVCGGSVTWGVVGGSPNWCRAAALRCEATVPGGPARQAASSRCCHVTGANAPR